MMRATKSIRCPLQEAAARRPEAAALITPGRLLGYGDLERHVAATARRLRRRSVEPGARVALLLPNTWPSIVLLLALLRVRGVACLLSTRLPDAGVRRRMRQLNSRMLITDRPGVVEPHDPVIAVPPGVLVREADEAEEAGKADAAGRLLLEQPATVVFTSGSTGEPKAALHAFGNHYFSARGSNENLALAPGDRWLLSLPLYHVGGLGIVFRCLLAGAGIVLAVPGSTMAEALTRHDVTHASMVATQLWRALREEPGPALSRLKALLLGGGPLPRSLLEAARRRGVPIHTSYGLTEMTSQVTTTPPGAPQHVLQTAGQLLPYRELHVAGDGEIWVRGETLFQGYLTPHGVQRPEQPGGWFATGDLGRLTGEGHLVVQGRKDNRFISGGENVYPEEVEQALCRLPGVVQAVVVPVPDEEFGQRPVAFVETSGAAGWGDLRRALQDLLPGYKVPRAFYAWPEDAEAASGPKVSRRLLQDRAQRLEEGKR